MGGAASRGLGSTAKENEFEVLNTFEVLSQLSHSSKKVRFKATGDIVVLKQISKDDYSSQLQAEVAKLRELNHENILKVFDIYQINGQSILYSCSYVENAESLEDRIITIGQCSNSDSIRIVTQICEAVSYLHAQGLYHLDMKPSNLLLPAGKLSPVTICDLGFALTTHAPCNMGTPYYVAPELFDKNAVATPKVDVWSIGVIAYMLLLGRAPFQSDQQRQVELIRRIRTEPVDILETDEVADAARSFICACMEKRPEDRLDSLSLLESKWFQDIPPSDINGECLGEDDHQAKTKLTTLSSVENNPAGATYGIKFGDMLELLERYATILEKPMTVERIPGEMPVYSGLTSHNLRDYFRAEDVFPPSHPTSKHYFIQCNAVDVAITYLWTLPLKGVIDLLLGDTRYRPVHDNQVVWLDILSVYQNAPNIVEALSVSKKIYESSTRHVVLTLKAFERTWCLYELYLRMQRALDSECSESELLEFRCAGGSADERERQEGLRRIGHTKIFHDMQAFSADDKATVKSLIQTTATPDEFDEKMRSIYASFVRKRRCTPLMEAMICMYLGGKVSNPDVVNEFIGGKILEETILDEDIKILEWPSP